MIYGEAGADRSHTRWPGWRPPRRASFVAARLPELEDNTRLRYACPICGAKRYEHCFETRALLDPYDGQSKEIIGYYHIEKPIPCRKRPKARE